MHPRFQVDQSPPPPIFYKMKSLELESTDAEADLCACIAVINESPALHSFAADEGPRSTVLLEVCPVIFLSLGRSGRPLKSLVLLARSGSRPGPMHITNTYTYSLVELIKRSQLEELVLRSDAIISGIVLNVISGLPRLKTLGVTFDPRFLEGYRAPVPQNGFPLLECLKGDILAIRSLLTLPKFPRLARLVTLPFQDGRWVGWPVFREIVRTIGESCHALEVLHLSTKVPSEGGHMSTSEWPATSIFAHLQACPRLKDVRFDFSGSKFESSSPMGRELDLSDEQWEQLALAWPDLVSIWFGATWSPRPRATLRTIASFFGHCSQLSSFRIPVLARGGDAKALLEEVSPKQDPIHLDFQTSWIDKEGSQDIATFLAALAPDPKTNIHLPTPLSFGQYMDLSGYDITVEERIKELARRDDWQGIDQLVDSARNAGQP
ncbi:hypothetical protein FS837_009420 [Tulasnella sp. UAMH 9824]|nr:hypothetical protein FS837_009420 [Tulasnella sp. UAMH 9824]